MENYDKFILTNILLLYEFRNVSNSICNQIVKCNLFFFYSLLYKFKINTNIWIYMYI